MGSGALDQSFACIGTHVFFREGAEHCRILHLNFNLNLNSCLRVAWVQKLYYLHGNTNINYVDNLFPRVGG